MNNKIIDSYKQNFKSPLGAYVYMFLNQTKPELFVISSKSDNEFSKNLENLLFNVETESELLLQMNHISELSLKKIQSAENDLSKESIFKDLINIKYLKIDWNNTDAWENLNGLINYNNYSVFLINKDDLLFKMKQVAEEFSINSISINPNHYPNEFINDFQSGAKIMCDALEINPDKIGLNVLELNYKTEKGDFTGYVNYNSKENYEIMNRMVVNNINVFAHEWIHFIENALGFKGYSITKIIDVIDTKRFEIIFPELTNILDFKTEINKENSKYSKIDFPKAIKSAASFLEIYAIDLINFNDNIDKISKKFNEQIINSIDSKTCFNEFEKDIIKLLKTPYPIRYFSLLKAQCEIHIDSLNEKKLEKNQFIDFAKKSDYYLKRDGYTGSTIEMFARTFESYVDTKTKTKGKICNLVSGKYDTDFYPQGEIKTNTDLLWGNMWSQIKISLEKNMKNSSVEKKESVLNNIEKFREIMKKKILITNKLN
jgi:hypothetical protein